LSKLKIKCNNFENGCQQIVSFGSLSEHLNHCDHKPVTIEMEQKEEPVVQEGIQRLNIYNRIMRIIITLIILIAIVLIALKILMFIMTKNIMSIIAYILEMILKAILIIITLSITNTIVINSIKNLYKLIRG
jgi:uncharacterized Tic20 family protein